MGFCIAKAIMFLRLPDGRASRRQFSSGHAALCSMELCQAALWPAVRWRSVLHVGSSSRDEGSLLSLLRFSVIDGRR